MTDFSLENLQDASIGDIAGYFLSLVIIVASAAYIGLAVIQVESSGVTLSMIFYAVIPVALALIVYQSFRVARLLYTSAFHHEEDEHIKNKLVVGLVIAVAAMNLGFMTVLTSGPKMIEGQAGMYKYILLMVILSFTLAMSLLTDHTDLPGESE